MTNTAIVAEPSALTLAQQRAMPVTRMLDYGMDPWDAQVMFDRTSAGEAWDLVAESLAQPWLKRAETAEAAGRRVTAVEAYRHGTAALNFAQMAFNADVARKRELYQRMVHAIEQAAALSAPPIERVEPTEYGRLTGWLVRPSERPAAATVIVFGGLSGWGMSFQRHADALAARGLATLLVEGPGQGEPRLRHGIYLRADVDRAYSSFVTEALSRPELGGAVGICGNSFGGLFAALTAARDDRIGACCVNGAPSTPTLPEFRNAREQIFAALGTDHADQATALLDALKYDPTHEPIRCPLLVLHGGRDPLASLDDQRAFLAGAAPAQSTLKAWADGEHTIYNRAAERSAFVSDWFADQLTTPRQ